MAQLVSPKVRIIEDPPPSISFQEGILQKLNLLQEQNDTLQSRLTALENTLHLHAQPAQRLDLAESQAQAQLAQQGQAEEPSRLEAWLRRNLAWLDEPCPFKKATGRTWRQIAGNEGDKIPMNGKGLQVPRAYLHSIESWAEASENIRLKAKLALALCRNEASQ